MGIALTIGIPVEIARQALIWCGHVFPTAVSYSWIIRTCALDPACIAMSTAIWQFVWSVQFLFIPLGAAIGMFARARGSATKKDTQN